ncbi:transcriptional regulator GcvA [Collimonas sp. OK412]|jgi:LysR family glycine cleavage system transcriptional activator|uniref:transcriptional regulator GcvA n=1 Tax=Collimonas sp. (strain OK412) TaxID=1801619 RepID=UPI0008DFB91E|nr:transcriptional regulator GcvA [Collimonas sp. OK412]SFB69668.1 LysR family transcriptional regulator, glycine cleavage system transcriptional activator [Collimonas sp. OK412]
MENKTHPLDNQAARRLPPLAALKAFEAAARHLSIKSAAAELSVTPTAVSHQIRRLEDSLGVAVFQRLPRQLRLTSAGSELYVALRDGFDLFAAAIGRIRPRDAARLLTITTTPAFAARWLLPRLGAFRNAHPEQDLRLHTSVEIAPLDGHTADIAIRYGLGSWPGLVAEKLFDDRIAPVCSPLLKVKKPKDLLKHTLIHNEWQASLRNASTWRAWAKRAKFSSLDSQGGIVFSDESHAISAAIAGQGVALLSTALIEPELQSGLLVQPFGPVLSNYAFYLVYPEARRTEVQDACAWIGAQADASTLLF